MLSYPTVMPTYAAPVTSQETGETERSDIFTGGGHPFDRKHVNGHASSAFETENSVARTTGLVHASQSHAPGDDLRELHLSAGFLRQKPRWHW